MVQIIKKVWNYKLNGSSLLETVIASVIILFSFYIIIDFISKINSSKLSIKSIEGVLNIQNLPIRADEVSESYVEDTTQTGTKYFMQKRIVNGEDVMQLSFSENGSKKVIYNYDVFLIIYDSTLYY